MTIGTVGENAVRSFDATAGQKLTLTVSGNTIPGVNLVIRQPNNTLVGNLFLSGAASFLDTFTLPVSGTYTITIDPSGQNTGSLTFTLNNAPVAAANVGPAVGHADVAVLASAAGGRAKAARSGAVPDRESDVSAHVAAHTVPLVAAAAAPVSLTIQVSTLLANDRPGPANESDQTLTVTSVRTDASSHGTAVLADDAITFTADGGYVGPASFFYTACDNGTTDGQPDPRCSEGTINVKVTANHPPTVVGLHLETAEDSTLPVVLSGVDPDGDAVVFTIASEPAHGTLTGTAPNLTYRPAPDFHGKDSFAFSANDTHDASPPAVVEITVTEANDRPTAQPDSVTAGAGRTVTVAANELAANDAAGPFDEVIQTLTVTAVAATSDTHGTVTLSNGTVVYTPDAGFTGIAKMNYTVCDDGTSAGQPDPKCAEGVLTIVANRAPTAADVTAGTARNTAVTIDLDASDPEDDPLIFAIVAAPAHGALTGTGASRTYTPEAGFSGSDSFSYTAADATSTSAPATVSIVVTETPPPTVAPDVVATTTDQPVVIDVLANDTAGAGTLDAATLAIVTAPTNGTAVVENGAIRYTPAPGVTPEDRFTYRVCDTFGGCGQAAVSISVVAPNRPPVAKPDTYEIATGTTLHPAAPGVLANDSDPDPGDRMQARLVRGVTNGNLLLNSTGEFTYTPHGPGIDTFVYHVLDKAGLDSGEVTVTIVVTGPTGPPTVGNDFYDVQQGRELVVAAPGVLDDDFSPNPRLTLTALLQDDVAKGTLLLHPDGSFVYTPEPGFAGLDQFSYLVRDSEGRVSQEAHVGIRVAAGGPATATVGATSPAAGARITGPTHCTATLVPPAGETVTSWTVSYRRPGDPTLVQLATGSGTSVACEFDPTTIRNGTYAIVIRAETSGGGILVSETAGQRRGRLQARPLHDDVPRRRHRFRRHPDRPLPNLRQRRQDRRGLRRRLEPQAGAVPHRHQRPARRWRLVAVPVRFVPVPGDLLPDVETALRHGHLAGRASRAVQVRTRPGLVARAHDHHRRVQGRTRHDVDPCRARQRADPRRLGLLPRQLLLRGRDLRPDPVRPHGQVGREVHPRPARRRPRDRGPERQPRRHRRRRHRQLVGTVDDVHPRRREQDHADRGPGREHRLPLLGRRRPGRCHVSGRHHPGLHLRRRA